MSRTRAPTYLVHDLNMNGLISVFSQKIKTVQNSKRLFSVFSMYTRPPRPTILSLEELDSAATFPAEVIHNPTAVEKRVMNERRSRLAVPQSVTHYPSHVQYPNTLYSFSVSPSVALFEKDRHVTLYFLCSSPAESLPCSQFADVYTS